MVYTERELVMMKAMHRMRAIRFWDVSPEVSRGEAILLNSICVGKMGCQHMSGCDVCEMEKIKVPVSELVKITGMHSAAVSRLMNGMEKKGLILRSFDPDNHRNIIVSATEKGIEINKFIRDGIHKYWQQVFDMTPKEDIDTMLRILDEIMDNMEIVINRQDVKN